MKILKCKSQEEFQEWLNNLEFSNSFYDYNNIVFGLLENDIDLKFRGYGSLQWRRIAKYYNLSEFGKKLLEG